MRFILALLIILCPPVFAGQMVGRSHDGRIVITLTETPCTNGIVAAMTRPDVLPLMRAGNMIYHGRALELCWIITPDGKWVMIVDEDRDVTPVRIESFEHKPSI